jgi:photosystem II stability/assembly factor-like uncharacterized protein
VGKRIVLAVVAAAALAACGTDAAPITFDTAAPETTTPDTTAPPTAPPTAPRTAPPASPTVPGDAVGATWEEATGNLAGLPSECANLQYLSARPDRPGIIAGVSLQGLWSSEDGGATWAQLGQGAGSDEITFRLTEVAYDPDDPTHFWASGLYNGGGLYRTVDDGETFEQLSNLWSIDDIGVDFTDPERSTLVAPMHEQIQVYRSRDGGGSWEDISAGLPDEGGAISAVEVIDADTYLVGARDGRVPGIFRTADGGTTWDRVYPGGVAGAPVRASDGDLYWLIERGRGLATSADDGLTWSEIPSSSISPFATSLVELPDGRFVTMADAMLVQSSDRGVSWQPLGPSLPYDPSGLTFSSHDNAFYIWRFDCDFGEENPVRSSSIMRLAFEPAPR